MSGCSDHAAVSTLPLSSIAHGMSKWPNCDPFAGVWSVWCERMHAGRGHSESCRHWIKQSHGRFSLLATSLSGTKKVTGIDKKSGARQRQKFKNLGSQYFVRVVRDFLGSVHSEWSSIAPSECPPTMAHVHCRSDLRCGGRFSNTPISSDYTDKGIYRGEWTCTSTSPGEEDALSAREIDTFAPCHPNRTDWMTKRSFGQWQVTTDSEFTERVTFISSFRHTLRWSDRVVSAFGNNEERSASTPGS